MMQEAGQTADVLVIGAGMAGLIAAAELQRAGRRVLVLDKRRGVGGRLASRRIGAATFDHGAQFITARTSRFAALVDDGRRAGVVEEWHRGSAGRPEGHVRWRGHPAMTSVAKHLARGLEIMLETRVVALRASRHRWSAETAAGAYSAGAEVRTFQVHGWLYSKPLQVDERPCAMVGQGPPLVLAGDAFAGPRVEGAALSGWATAEAVLAVWS